MAHHVIQRDRDLIKQAFLTVCSGWPPDRVVADSELNSQFLAECDRLGVSASAQDRNRVLLNLRKGGRLRNLRSRRTTLPNQDEYRFASEIAIRLIERRDGATLDEVLCDPVSSAEFDQLARQIAPGFTSFEYRWAALSIRKNKGLKPEPLLRVVPANNVVRKAVVDIVADDIPDLQGVYMFLTSTKLLYVGEASSLRSRLRKHLDHSDNRQLAHWIWENKDEPLFVEYHVLPESISTRTRKAVELEIIRSRNPEFNIRR